MGRCRLADRADRPIRGHPFAGGVDEHGGETDQAAVRIDCGRLDRCDLMLAEHLADEVEPARERRIAKGPTPLAGKGERMVAVRDFSGFVSSACARASAAAIAPMVSLDWCIGAPTCDRLALIP